MLVYPWKFNQLDSYDQGTSSLIQSVLCIQCQLEGAFSKDLREGWISRDHILNYPNIVPKEIVSIESSLVNKDGKKVWFNWVNSMLPNGNYMGVGLDITKYKNS